ncbi:MAG: Gfo/Idh/MocA family oxidoreductase [Nitrospinota bacterium]|nr:Gfo/Idh/MocA family oxidoreductase [Nitrospinota bacterium]
MKNFKQNTNQIESTKVGVIGLGDISTKVHLPILSARKDTEIVWSFDINEDNAKHIAKIYGLRLLSPKTALIDFPEVDVILMAIPPTQRQTYLDFFLKSNTSFYIEKPFAFSASEHELICGKFAPFRLGNGLQYRSWGRTLLLKKIIEEKVFGNLLSIELGQGTPLSGFGGRKRKDVGGVLWDLGIHGLDMIFNVTKARSIEILKSDIFEDNSFALDVSASLNLHLVNEKTVTCKCHVSWIKETIEGCKFNFENAEFRLPFDIQSPVEILSKNKNKVLNISEESQEYPLTPLQTFSSHWDHFLDGISNQSSNRTSAENSLLTTQTIEKILEGKV